MYSLPTIGRPIFNYDVVKETSVMILVKSENDSSLHNVVYNRDCVY